MNCPVCKKETLAKHQLEADLPAYQCTDCGGIWISALQYWEWIKGREEGPPDLTADVERPIPIEEAAQAKLCPESGHILRRYKVWPDVKFYLDRCGSCSGLWFDRDEWDYLRSHEQHDDVHIFFTDMWQEKLTAEEARRRFERMYLDRFGAEDYRRIQEIRAWLHQHPLGSALLAYLTDKDPYRAVS